MLDLVIRCSCGAIRGIARGISPSTVNRVVCHCRGCIAYAHSLGRYDEIVDQRGGTEVFQMSPRNLSFTSGAEHLACGRMTKKGALRWYAACCCTPIAHTLASPRIPFLAVNHLCVDWSQTDQPRRAVIGPVRARVNIRLERREAKRLAATRCALAMMLVHFMPKFVFWLLRGDAKRSPFFDATTGRLIAGVKPLPAIAEEAGPARPW